VVVNSQFGTVARSLNFSSYPLVNHYMSPTIPSQAPDAANDPFVAYSRALYEYTFSLWQESKRVVEEGALPDPTVKAGEPKRKPSISSTKDQT
jgi:hypothetical protein